MKRLLVVALLGLAPLALAQETLRVGDVSAARGTKVTGVIHIPDGVDKGLDIPVSERIAEAITREVIDPITAESGGLGRTDEASIDIHLKGALSVINHLGIMAAPSVKIKNPVWIDKSEVLTSPATGVWEPAIDQKDAVVAGSLVGRVKDAAGKVLGEVCAPFAGVMLYVVGTPPITKGEPVGFVGRVKADGP